MSILEFLAVFTGFAIVGILAELWRGWWSKQSK